MFGTLIYEATPEEVEYAKAWHGGQSSMLYAVASTGELARGVICPPQCENEDEWSFALVTDLMRELNDTIPAKSEVDMAVEWMEKLVDVAEGYEYEIEENR